MAWNVLTSGRSRRAVIETSYPLNMLTRHAPAIAILLLAAGMVLGQTSTPAPAFEVASIKAAAQITPQTVMAGKLHVGVNVDGARVDIGNLSLSQLLCYAYTLKPFQLSGPDWMNSQRFDVLAKLPEGASKDQVPEMLQALLTERFQLKLHRDNKDLPVYALVVGKNGPKLKEAAADAEAPNPEGAPAFVPPPGGPGFGPPPGPPPGPGGMRFNRDGKGMTVAGGPMGPVRISPGADGAMHLELPKATMTMFADMLTQFADRPVLDMTELKGNYEVALDLSIADMMNAARAAGMGGMMMGPGGPPPGSGPGPSSTAAGSAGAASDPVPSAIFANVQKLGLKLDPRKSPVTTLVIDHAEKMPTEN